MNVGIYHPFINLADNYSLSHVVVEQMLMLTEHGHTPHFITSHKFRGKVPEGTIVHAILPNTTPQEIKQAAEPIIKQCTVTLTHDIVYLDSYRDHVDALKQIKTNYIHWIHSAPNKADKREALDGRYIGMNYTDLPLLAEQFNIPQGRCSVVYNPVSPDRYFGWHPFTKCLVERHNLLDCDILITYPLDTGRFTDKGGYKIIRLIEKLRNKKKDAKVVFVNAAANNRKRRQEIKPLSNSYTIFTSLEDREYEVSVPHQVVRELFQISNLFPLLSISEGCSLTMLEAALAKNLVILNEDFPAMKEFGEIDHTLYMKVSSTRCRTTYNPSEDSYYDDWANIVISKLGQSHMNLFNRKVLKKFSRNWIWKNQLEPLLPSP